MGTELELLLAVVDRVRMELHPDLPQEFLRKVLLIEEEMGAETGEAIKRIRSLVTDVAPTGKDSA